ncbi:MAG: hypothetical protein ACHREM_16225 [Polyangiales bacterium]
MSLRSSLRAVHALVAVLGLSSGCLPVFRHLPDTEWFRPAVLPVDTHVAAVACIRWERGDETRDCFDNLDRAMRAAVMDGVDGAVSEHQASGLRLDFVVEELVRVGHGMVRVRWHLRVRNECGLFVIADDAVTFVRLDRLTEDARDRPIGAAANPFADLSAQIRASILALPVHPGRGTCST